MRKLQIGTGAMLTILLLPSVAVATFGDDMETVVDDGFTKAMEVLGYLSPYVTMIIGVGLVAVIIGIAARLWSK